MITGSRKYRNFKAFCYWIDRFLAKYENSVAIVTGNSSGTEWMARKYADIRGYHCLVFPADWEKNGRRAGYVRYDKMHDYVSHQPLHGCVYFYEPGMPEILYNIDISRRNEIPMRIMDIRNKRIISS